MNDHIEGIFNNMLDDIKMIKLSTYFMSELKSDRNFDDREL